MNRQRVVAVTGATGFLGRHLVVALAGQGARLRLLVRGQWPNHLWHGIPFEIVQGDLEDEAALQRLVTGADAVVHAAGRIKAHDRAEFLRTNRDGTLAVARATRRFAPEARLIAVSSLAAREPQLSDYAASKQAGEAAARAAYADAPEHLVIVRPPAIYGPWDAESLAIFKAARHAIVPVFGAGRMALIHVTDAAAAIAQLSFGAGTAGFYALSDPKPAGYTLREVLLEAARAMNSKPRFLRLPGGVLLAAGKASAWWGRRRRTAPIFTEGKAREMLHPDWSVHPFEALPPTIHQPKISLQAGFQTTAAWYKSAKWL